MHNRNVTFVDKEHPVKPLALSLVFQAVSALLSAIVYLEDHGYRNSLAEEIEDGIRKLAIRKQIKAKIASVSKIQFVGSTGRIISAVAADEGKQQ